MMPELLLVAAIGLGICCSIIVFPAFSALFPTDTPLAPMYDEPKTPNAELTGAASSRPG